MNLGDFGFGIYIGVVSAVILSTLVALSAAMGETFIEKRVEAGAPFLVGGTAYVCKVAR